VADSSTAGQGVERSTSEEEADTCMPAGAVDNRPPGPEEQGTASVIAKYTLTAVLGYRSKTFAIPNDHMWPKNE
jgi:hypothetical protein